jgi:hypothetical protein
MEKIVSGNSICNSNSNLRVQIRLHEVFDERRIEVLQRQHGSNIFQGLHFQVSRESTIRVLWNSDRNLRTVGLWQEGCGSRNCGSEPRTANLSTFYMNIPRLCTCTTIGSTSYSIRGNHKAPRN